MACSPVAGRAATNYVNGAGGSDANDGASWGNAWATVTNALFLAAPNDEIWVAAGTYRPGTLASDSFIITKDLALYGGFVSGGTMGNRDWVANEAALDGDLTTTNASHVIRVTGGTTILLDGFSIRNGLAADDTGGGIDCDAGTLTVRNCLITNNLAYKQGGALYLNAAGAAHTFSNCIFAANATLAGVGPADGGGALYQTTGGDTRFLDCTFRTNTASGHGAAWYGKDADADTRFVNCHFTNNTAEGPGGALFVYGTGSGAIVSNCTFTGNEVLPGAANGGGAIRGNRPFALVDCIFSNNVSSKSGGAFDYNTDGYTNIVRHCVFYGNRTSPGNGGAIIANRPLRIDTCVFSDNLCSESGGALYCDTTGTNVLRNCSFQRNQAVQSGGAIYWKDGDIQLQACVFTTNQAGSEGGAIYVTRSADATPMRNCVFARNAALGAGVKGGGAVHVGSRFVPGAAGLENCTFYGNFSAAVGGAVSIQRGWAYATNSIFWENSAAGDGAEVYINSSLCAFDVGYGDMNTNNIYNNGGALFLNEGMANVNPLFVDAAANDFHLQSAIGHWTVGGWVADGAHSPCIDAGDPDTPFGQERHPHGMRINLGAYGGTVQASKSPGGGLIIILR